jgi:hypothetical protein
VGGFTAPAVECGEQQHVAQQEIVWEISFQACNWREQIATAVDSE